MRSGKPLRSPPSRGAMSLHFTTSQPEQMKAPGGSSDLIALESGVALSNQTAGNEVILIDLKRRSEIARLPSSSLGGIRPVHMYLSLAIEGRQYVVVLNDGNERNTPKGERPKDSILLLIDATQASPTFLKSAGETPASTLAIIARELEPVIADRASELRRRVCRIIRDAFPCRLFVID
jgi:hypothetical protein